MVPTLSPCHQPVSGECQGNGAGYASRCRVLPNLLCSNPSRMAPGMCPEAQGCSGCSTSQHSSKDLGRAAAHSLLSPSCPEPAQCPHGVPGDGANHPCSHTVSPRAAHSHPLRWHPGEAVGEECPAPLGGLGIRGGTGVCRCRPPAAHACGKGSAPESPGWNLGVSGHFLPLPFPAAGARGLRAMGWPELARGRTGRLRFTAPEGNGL